MTRQQLGKQVYKALQDGSPAVEAALNVVQIAARQRTSRTRCERSSLSRSSATAACRSAMLSPHTSG